MGRYSGPGPWPDCGSQTAEQRHARYREPLCTSCRQNRARRRADRHGGTGTAAQVQDLRAVRNDLPETPGYRWRARTYPWAQRVIAASEAVHGVPDIAYMRSLGHTGGDG